MIGLKKKVEMRLMKIFDLFKKKNKKSNYVEITKIRDIPRYEDRIKAIKSLYGVKHEK